MGRLTRDPEVRYSQGDNPMAIARFSLAVDRRRTSNNQDGQTADFINIVTFGKLGEFAEKYLHKGTKVTLSGRIQTGSYTNKDGQKVYTTEVVADEIEFAESKNSSSSDMGGNNVKRGQCADIYLILALLRQGITHLPVKSVNTLNYKHIIRVKL